MKALLPLSIVAALFGFGLGAVLAYVEVAPVMDRSIQPDPAAVSDKAVPDPAPLPQAEFPETVYKFGNMEQGTSMSHEFIVRNVGELPLRLEVASTTCKCTVGDLPQNEIAPDKESHVLLEWAAKTGPGPFRHGAVLKTNDPLRSSIELTVEGQIVESTAMSPSELFFGTVSAGDQATAEFYLMTFIDEVPEIRDYELSDQELASQIEVKITPVDRAELPSPDAVAGLKVAATFQSGNTVGPFRDWLTLTTNLEKAEKISVPLSGRVVGDVLIFGRGWDARNGLLKLGTFSGDKGHSVSLKIAVRGEFAQQAQFEVAETDPPQLQATLGEPRKMNENLLHMPLEVVVPPGTAPIVRLGEPISSDAHIVLRSKHEKIPDVRLRVRFAAE